MSNLVTACNNECEQDHQMFYIKKKKRKKRNITDSASAQPKQNLFIKRNKTFINTKNNINFIGILYIRNMNLKEI